LEDEVVIVIRQRSTFDVIKEFSTKPLDKSLT